MTTQKSEEITPEFLEDAFRTHFTGMHRYAYTLLRNDEAAKDAVQQVFTMLWENKDRIRVTSSPRGYLFRAIYNHCLNRITRSPRTAFLEEYEEKDLAVSADWLAECRELQTQIHQAIADLPDGCKEIFLKSRNEQKSYAEIASEGGISVKTVEAQISKALRILRTRLGAYGIVVCALLMAGVVVLCILVHIKRFLYAG